MSDNRGRQVKSRSAQQRACVLLLYEFPGRYTVDPDYVTGAVDGASWLTRDAGGAEGDSVPSGAALYVRGWALDLDQTGPPAHIVLIVDGVHKFHARVGVPRHDVASHFGNDAFAASGFEAIVTTGRLEPGDHQIVGYVVDPQTWRFAPLRDSATFTIVADWTTLPADASTSDASCEGILDGADDESRGLVLEVKSGAVAVPRGSRLKLHGWFFDREGAEPISRAYAVVDGERAYPVDYGLPRADVATKFDREDPMMVGFEARIPTAGLIRGAHSVEIVAIAADGETRVATSIALEFVVGQSTSARFTRKEMTTAFFDDIVRVEEGAVRIIGSPLRVLRGDRIFVRGWAIDEAAKSVAAGVVLLLDGKVEIPALYGLPRPDVADSLHDASLTRSGFTGEIETNGLTTGMHSAECRVLARDGQGAFTTAQRFEFEVSEN